MMTIRTTADVSKPTLVGLEVAFHTPNAVYDLAPTKAMTDAAPTAVGGLFGRIAWPICQFRITSTLLIE